MASMDSPAVTQIDGAMLPLSPYHLPMIAGSYFSPGTSSTTLLNAEAYEFASLFIPSRSCTIDRLGAFMSVTGSAGAVLRLAVRAYDAATGLPGAVLAQGTADATVAAPSALAVTVSVPVIAATAYVLTATIQGAAVTRPTLATHSAQAFPVPYGSAPVASSPGGLYVAGGVTGALAAAPTWTPGGAQAIRVWVRAA